MVVWCLDSSCLTWLKTAALEEALTALREPLFSPLVPSSTGKLNWKLGNSFPQACNLNSPISCCLYVSLYNQQDFTFPHITKMSFDSLAFIKMGSSVDVFCSSVSPTPSPLGMCCEEKADVCVPCVVNDTHVLYLQN